MAVVMNGAAGGPRAGIDPGDDTPMLQTVVNNYTAILSGYTWYGQGASDHPVIITYSFSDAPQPYLSDEGFTDDFIASFVPFSAADEALARAAITQWADASGVIAIEAPAGQGDIQFGRFDFREEPVMNGFDGYAFYPNAEISSSFSAEDPLGGDVFINFNSPLDMYLALHEIGHAMGFKHPFDGDPTLPPNLDNTAHTVMSYTGAFVTSLGPFDLDAIEFYYGDSSSDGTHVASWSWNETTATLTQIGFDGADTIRGIYGNDIMLGQNGNDTLFGSFGLDQIEGNGGKDFLFGWDGDDTLTGGKAADFLKGGEGGDTFIYGKAKESTGTKYDTIAGFDALNADTIDVRITVNDVDDDIVGGHLANGAGFDTDLENAVTSALLGKRDAVLFLPDSGNLAGSTFLIVDLNRVAGYQAGEDLVIRLTNADHLGSLDVLDFV